MKYYSDKTGKLYECEKELVEAEETFDEQKKLAEKKIEAEKLSKKELADKIDEACTNLDAAREDFNKAKEALISEIKESIESAEQSLQVYREEVKKAEEAKYQAISEFNKKYGAYTKVYSGDKAYNEFKKNLDWIINPFFPFF